MILAFIGFLLSIIAWPTNVVCMFKIFKLKHEMELMKSKHDLEELKLNFEINNLKFANLSDEFYALEKLLKQATERGRSNACVKKDRTSADGGKH